ncbi:MAG TPA: mechanosensitive ion channel domain-containing protein [Rhizobacter sp.]|nr:mechanosensitive ion channel domain-containing protein [Rhizobacter sp.]
MNATFDLKELQDLLHNLTSQSALTELAVLLGCLGLSWLVSAMLRRVFKLHGAVLFGDNVIDGVMFPVLALMLALLSSHLLAGVVKVAVFKLAIPILTSLVLIRLTVRVLTAAYPHNGWVRAFERTLSWVAWIAAVLWITGVLPMVMQQLDEVRWQLGKTQISLRHLVEGTITGGVVMVLVLWLSSAIERKIIHGTGNDLSMRKMISNIVRTVLLFVGLLVAMSAVGLDLTALSVLGGALGVGLGFGLQKIAANYVSGFVILAERSLRIGDMVKVDNFEGRIVDIRTRYTVIRSLGGRESILPNEMLITQRVENSSLADSRVLVSSSVQVAYGTDVRALQPKLVAAMLGVSRVLEDPAPGVQLAAFSADGMDLSLQFWIRDPENGQGAVKSDVHLAVLEVLNAEGVEIPFPQRVMHTRPAPAAPAG